MGPKTPVTEGDFFRPPLREQINLKHPLVGLADLINWGGGSRHRSHSARRQPLFEANRTGSTYKADWRASQRARTFLG